MRRWLILLAALLCWLCADGGDVYLGDFPEDASVTFYWGSYDGSGASITRATDGTVKVIRDDGTDVTGTSVTDTEDSLDTGVHKAVIDTSDGANYTTGHDYTVWLDGAVIDGQTVNAPLRQFSIENRYSDQTGDSFARIGAAGVGLTSVALADATSDAVIADAVWNALTATYGAANSYGLLAETNLDAAITTRSSHSAAEVVVAMEAGGTKLDTLYDDWLDGGRLDLLIDSIITNLATVDGIVDDILVDTGTTLPATLSGLATSANVAVIDGVVDAILVDTAQMQPLLPASTIAAATDVKVIH